MAFAQSKNPEWDKVVEAAKKEGKVVVSLPASNELRAAIERLFEKRYGIDVEPVVGRASTLVRKMVDESKAGVRYMDIHLGGSESIVTGLLPEGVIDALEPYMLLPEVKDPKQWWGGHVWVDTAKKFVYSTSAHQPEILWFNSQLMKAEDVRSFDDLLDEKLRGKIGYLDPRTPVPGRHYGLFCARRRARITCASWLARSWRSAGTNGCWRKFSPRVMSPSF